MNWDAIGAVAEAVGAVGVIASLFYLGRQLRLNSKAISEELFQSLLNNYHGGMDQLLSNQETVRIFYLGLRDYDALTEDEKALWVTLVHAFMRRYENIVLQSRKYGVDEGVVESIKQQWHQLLSQPGAKKFWSRGYKTYSPAFVEFLAERHDLHFDAEAGDSG